MKPRFIMLVGLPGSGKSRQAGILKDQYDANIHSSDQIREELFGDENCNQDNHVVFKTLHNRVISDLKCNKNVVYDATNISYKRRMDFLRRVTKQQYQRICLFMATPFGVCCERNRQRGRVVPHDALSRMYKTIWIPNTYEGWDSVELIYTDGFALLSVSELFDRLNRIKQDNPHHALTIGHHCAATYDHIDSASKELQEAALLHDIGKAYTKSFVNSRGETTDIAHYYNHQHVSAYDSLFYSDPECDRLHVASVIQWHMRPFEIKRADNPQVAQEKFRGLVGDRVYSDVMQLHDADIRAKGI